ncbi:MAG: InlB B-repeat-containing protein [Oscillospiraceae bacterium]
MKSKRIIAMLCTLAVMFSSSGGLPISDRELFDSAITVNAVENVAKVDDTVYTDFNTALNNWTAGKTLTLLNDVTSSRISVLESKTLDLNGKTITFSNDNTESRVIHVGNAGTVLTLKDSSGNNSGRLTGINTPSNDWSGALYINSGATVNMYGGTISGNTSYCGAGVWIDGRGHRGNATFNMYGGVITGNNATSGGGVYVGRQNDKYAGTAHFNLYGGTITGNTATTGSNVYVDKGVMTQTGGTLDGGFVDKLDRYVSLTFNANGSSGSMSEQYIQKNVDTLIKQNTFTRNGFLYSGWNKDANGSGTGYDADGSITIDTDTTLYAQWTSIAASVTAGGTTTSYTSLSDALSAWTDDSTLTLLNNVETSSTINISGTKVLDLNGYGIKMTGSGSVINVGNNANLTLKDSNPDVKHKYTIANPQSNGAGLAVVDDTNGTQSFTGGYITGGNAEYGGGVYTNGGNIIINGGTIIGNKVSSSANTKGGGGVCIDAGTLTMKDGAVIGNYAYLAKGAQGGGLTLLSTANFTMSGGIISCNYSNGCGGGVQANNYAVGNITISGGKICNNYTKQGGGINSGGTVNLTGGSICDNIADNGGGICAQKVILSGSAIIQNNNKQISGKSDICLYGSKLLTINAQLNENNSNPIVVGIYQGGTGIFTNSTNTAYNDSSKFISDNDNYAIVKNADGQLCLVTAVTVIFDADGGSAVKNQTVASGNTADEPIAPTKTGYTFDGWYDGDTKFDFSTPITGDMTLTAKWLKNPTYTVTIPADVKCSNSNSASAIISAEYDVGELYTLSVAVTSENNFQLKANYDNRVLIPYTIMCDDKRLSMGQTEILSVSGNGEQSKTLNFSVDPSQMYAGAYSDTLTFNISLT